MSGIADPAPPTKRFRAVLPLLKGRVCERGPDFFKLAIGGSTTITVNIKSDLFDIRDGDLLTIYTEVLTKEVPTNG